MGGAHSDCNSQGGSTSSLQVASGAPTVVNPRPVEVLETADLDGGRLVEVLAGFPSTPSPVSVLHPPNRQLSPRVPCSSTGSPGPSRRGRHRLHWLHPGGEKHAGRGSAPGSRFDQRRGH